MISKNFVKNFDASKSQLISYTKIVLKKIDALLNILTGDQH